MVCQQSTVIICQECEASGGRGRILWTMSDCQSQLLTSPLETNDFPSHLTTETETDTASPSPCEIFQMTKLYSESQVAGVGRVLVATQDIPSGQTVLEDSCLVAGPDGLAVCLGCLAPLPPLHLQVACGRCLWPLCSEQCQTSPDHLQECEVFSSSQITPKTCGAISLWYSIVPLGMLRFGSFRNIRNILLFETSVKY